MRNLHNLTLVAAFVLAAPVAAAAQNDPAAATPDHSGKHVDDKTNGITNSTATTVKEQEKEQPKVEGGQTAEPGAAGAPAAK